MVIILNIPKPDFTLNSFSNVLITPSALHPLHLTSSSIYFFGGFAFLAVSKKKVKKKKKTAENFLPVSIPLYLVLQDKKKNLLTLNLKGVILYDMTTFYVLEFLFFSQ